jgi:hypothetical protein
MYEDALQTALHKCATNCAMCPLRLLYNVTDVRIINFYMRRDVTAGDHYGIKFCITRRIFYSLWKQKRNQFVSGCISQREKY